MTTCPVDFELKILRVVAAGGQSHECPCESEELCAVVVAGRGHELPGSESAFSFDWIEADEIEWDVLEQG